MKFLDQNGNEVDPPAHLREDAKPAGRCTACGRKTWSVSEVGRRCNMLQPDGQICTGKIGSGPAAGNWQLITEKMPEISTEVLIYHRAFTGAHIYNIGIRFPDQPTEVCCMEHPRLSHMFTHWMPLPTPPARG